ncbi:hypothetical protein MASR2M47_35020 [Draconibacterium sp.]
MNRTTSLTTAICLMVGIFVFFINQSNAQQPKIDSLLAVLETSKPDTNKVKTLYALADIYNDTAEPLKTMEFANKGISLSEELKFKRGISICLNVLGLAYYQLGKFDTALINFEKRMKIAIEMKDSFGVASTCDNMGIIQIHFGDNEKALELRMRANNIYTLLKMKSHLASGYNWIGNIYKDQGKYTVALENYLNALKIFEEEKDEENMGYPLLNISSIYRYLKQLDKAKEYAFQATEKFETAKNKSGVGVCLFRTALIYTEEKDYQRAIDYLLRAKAINEEVPNIYSLTLVNQSLGNNYHSLRNDDFALKYFNSAFEDAQKMGDQNLIAAILQNIGAVYWDKGEYQKAIENSQKAGEIYSELNDLHALMQLSQNYVEMYSRINKPDSVVKYFQNYMELSDSLFNEKTASSIAEMQTKYETEKKEKELEISALKIREQKSNLVLMAILIIILLLNSAAMYYLHRKKLQKNLIIAKSQLQITQLQEAEISNRVRNTVSDETTQQILEKLAYQLETAKCYLNPDLNLNTLAQLLGTNREYLSQIINKTYDKNFSEFVNYYRVQESIEIIKKIVSNVYENWTMETVAEKSGFKYTSTFNPAFKSVMNMSPTEFKKVLKNM